MSVRCSRPWSVIWLQPLQSMLVPHQQLLQRHTQPLPAVRDPKCMHEDSPEAQVLEPLDLGQALEALVADLFALPASRSLIHSFWLLE